MTTVISVENLSKYYRLGTIGNRTLYEDLNRWWARMRGKPDPALKIGETDYGNREGEYIWALRDVSFQVQQGEVLGIIGRNGAGKSTLLKILSRVTAPTSGNVKVRGRIASLLEVGTGFHPELTGRENVYLNGAILGMSRTEIDRKLDEIIDFSGVEKFIDTPVKRYSSGMYVRLAFAVAAHLEPEILVVDEVLAVGDAEFQKKCLGKMGNVAQEGRTVLFVSHNMGAIQQLTKRCVLLRDGKLRQIGTPKDVVGNYLSENSNDEGASQSTNLKSKLDGFYIKKFFFDKNKVKNGFNKPLYFVLELDLHKKFKNIMMGFSIVNSVGAMLITFEKNIKSLKKSDSKITFTLENHHLPPGNYSMVISLDYMGTAIFSGKDVISFVIKKEGISDIALIRQGDRIGIKLEPTCTIE